MIAWLIGSLALAQTAPAPAPAAPAADGEARAKVLFENGSQLYEEGQYEAAMVAFRSALEAWPDATSLHYNLSNCHERLGQLKEAYDELNLYRATAPEDERDTIARRLKSLEERMAQAPAPAPATAAVVSSPGASPAPVSVSVARRHPRWAVVGVGVGAAVVGGAGAGWTYGRSRDAIEATDRDAYDSARTLNGASFVLGGVGVGLTALGLAWQTTLGDHTTVGFGPTGFSGSF